MQRYLFTAWRGQKRGCLTQNMRTKCEDRVVSASKTEKAAFSGDEAVNNYMQSFRMEWLASKKFPIDTFGLCAAAVTFQLLRESEVFAKRNGRLNSRCGHCG